MKILVVEDQIKIAQSIKQGLLANGYLVDLAESGLSAEALCSGSDYDLIIMDIMIPDQNGIDTIRHLRRDGYNGPVLILSALSTTKDKIIGLDAGADDYLSKPFSFDELLARVRALLRRTNSKDSQQSANLKYSDLELDLIHRKFRRNNSEISLTTKEYSLLEYFMRHPERPLSRTQIAEHVWETSFDASSNVIDVYINLLRKKIESPNSSKLIHTVVGVGYIFSDHD